MGQPPTRLTGREAKDPVPALALCGRREDGILGHALECLGCAQTQAHRAHDLVPALSPAISRRPR